MKKKPLEFIKSQNIDAALANNYRQYFTGRFSAPDQFFTLIDANTEVGMSLYRDFTADKPHVHPVCTEFNYVLEGSVRMLLPEAGVEYEFERGDFYVLRPNTAYATKNFPGTRVLFIKSPGRNDKKLISVDSRIADWLSCWDADYIEKRAECDED